LMQPGRVFAFCARQDCGRAKAENRRN